MSLFKSAAIGAVCTLIGFAASAADYGDPMFAPPPLEAEQPMELGTGWYLRGDTSWSQANLPLLNGDGSLSASKAKSSNYAFGLGAGYKFNNWFRSDLTFDVSNIVQRNRSALTLNDGVTNIICPSGLTPLATATGTPVGYLWSDTSGTCSEKQTTNQRTMTMMLNGYVDLGTWSKVTPYLGAGVGVARISSTSSDNFYRTSDGALYAPTAISTPPWTLTTGTPAVWHNGINAYVTPTIPNTTTPVSITSPPNWNKTNKTLQSHESPHFPWTHNGLI